jgi:hypothetical protein
MENSVLCHVPVGTVFPLDGVPSHSSHHAHAFLGREFPDHWPGRGGDRFSPLHSPYFTSLDFLFRGFVKGIVYQAKV